MTKPKQSESAVREFWLFNNGEIPFLAYETKEQMDEDVSTGWKSGKIHVIEYSAYEQAQAKIKELEAENALLKLDSGLTNDGVIKLSQTIRQNEKLLEVCKLQREALNVAYEWIKDMNSTKEYTVRSFDHKKLKKALTTTDEILKSLGIEI